MISTFISLPLNTISIIIISYQLFYMFNISSIWHDFEVMNMFSTICEIWSGIQFFINQFIQIKYYLNKYEKMIVMKDIVIELSCMFWLSKYPLFTPSYNLKKSYREKEVSRCIYALYSACWLLVMRVFIDSIRNNSWQPGLIK